MKTSSVFEIYDLKSLRKEEENLMKIVRFDNFNGVLCTIFFSIRSNYYLKKKNAHAFMSHYCIKTLEFGPVRTYLKI